MKPLLHCRYLLVLLAVLLTAADAAAIAFHDAPPGRRPKIIGQKNLSTYEEQPITIQLTDLEVEDDDDWFYPWGFTLEVIPGDGYQVTGHTVTPENDFDGQLVVEVRVSDGEDFSNNYPLKIDVIDINDAPVVVLSQGAVFARPDGQYTKIATDITITDADDDVLQMATVTLGPENYFPGDILAFNPTASIRGMFDPNTGVLSFIGTAPVAEYLQVMKSITFEYSTAEGSYTRDSLAVHFSVNDGEVQSQPTSRKILFSEEQIALDVPTGFTPNGDFVNDTWSVRPLLSADFSEAVVRIFTRSGLKVYESRGLDGEWDGRHDGAILPADVYFYTIDFQLPDSKSSVKGIVTLLR